MRNRKPEPINIEALLGEDHGLSEEYVTMIRKAHELNWASGTHDVYRKQWGYFKKWCGENGMESLPAHPAVVSVYVCKRLLAGWAVPTVVTAVSAIGYFHGMQGYGSPTSNLGFREVMRGLKREYGRPGKQVKGMSEEDWVKIVAKACQPRKGETEERAERRGILDIVLVSLMSDGLLRRSEAAEAKWDDLEQFEVDGERYGVLQINRSKRDQEGRGASVFVWGETLEYMDRMKELYPRRKRARKGCILPIDERQIANRIKAAAEWAGLSGQYSGHSPRIGAIQELVSSGVEKPSLMKEARLSSEKTMSVYTRNLEVGKGAMAKHRRSRGSRKLVVRTI